MKIRELSIGDWVKIKGTDKIVKIAQINGDLDEIRVFGYKHFYCFYDLDYIEPIPLTPEILEKNGFEKLKDKSWVGHNHHCDIQQHGSSWTLLSNKRGFYRTICFESLEFVHELQHALRLADVRKEIEV